MHCARLDAFSGGISWNATSWKEVNRKHLYYLYFIIIYQICACQATNSIGIIANEMPRFSECWRCGKPSATVICRSCGVAKYCSNKCKANDIARHNDAECRPVSIVDTCSSCRKTGSLLQKCTGCYRSFYCNPTCQKNHRHEHKVECKHTVAKIKKLAQSLYHYFPPNFSRICVAHYYWGNAPAYDYLNLSENEGIDYSSTINLLVLGVGDLRNVVMTCASLPESFTSKVKFTLNDSDRCVLARLVLLLYMMIKCKFVT